MTTAILSALPEEQSSLVQHLAHPQRLMHAGRAFWLGDLYGRRVVLALSGIGKVNFGVGAKCQLLFSVVEAVFEMPQFATGGSNQQEKSPSIEKFVCFLIWFGGSDLDF